MKSIDIDLSKHTRDEPDKCHNRWHPAIPPALEVNPGEEVVIMTRNALDGEVTPATTAADLGNVNLNVVHALTGPVYVKGVQPGDLLQIDIDSIEPGKWGFTTITPGFGFLRDIFEDPFITHWDIDGDYAVSSSLPGVRIPGAPFMGIMGVAPSEALRKAVIKREAAVADRGGIALPPDPHSAVPGSEPLASEALRTVPPREFGGNMDIKQLTAGTRLLLPVFVEGGLFSAGDAHFAQGDSECCGTAIEMDGTLSVRFEVLKGQADRRNIRFPVFERVKAVPADLIAAGGRFLATTGMCIGEDGVNESENVTLAARNALVNMIDLLMEKGWSRQQAYCICSVAVDLKISELVDVPNVIVSAFLPLDIFQG